MLEAFLFNYLLSGCNEMAEDFPSVPPSSSAVTIDPISQRVRAGGREIVLTAKEHKLLSIFIANPDALMTAPQLTEKLYGTGYAVSDSAIRSHIYTLRKKLGAYAKTITSINGMGYRYTPVSLSLV